MDDLTALPIGEFLDKTAARCPTPGGGAVTALAGALACAMARMVAAYSFGKKTEPSVRDAVQSVATRLGHTDKLMRALVSEDARVYAAMTDSAKALQAAADAPDAKEHYREAVMAALAVPLEIAAVASNALTTMDDFKSSASKYLISDLGVAAVLAQATARAARFTVHVNLPQLDDPAMRAKLSCGIDETVAHCDTRLASIEGFVNERLEQAATAGR